MNEPLTITFQSIDDRELQAVAICIEALKAVENNGRQRVLDYLCARFPHVTLKEST